MTVLFVFLGLAVAAVTGVIVSMALAKKWDLSYEAGYEEIAPGLAFVIGTSIASAIAGGVLNGILAYNAGGFAAFVTLVLTVPAIAALFAGITLLVKGAIAFFPACGRFIVSSADKICEFLEGLERRKTDKGESEVERLKRENAELKGRLEREDSQKLT